MAAEVDTRSWWSVVRYVPRVERQEYRNVGVLVVRIEPLFAKARFVLPKSFPLQRYRLLSTVMGEIGFELPNRRGVEFQATSPLVDLSRLRRIYEKQTNIFQFKEPLPDPRPDADTILEDLYRIYIAPIPSS